MKKILKKIIPSSYLDNFSETVLSKLMVIIEQVAKEENLNITDIKYETSGSITSVYRLGNKVIKIGSERINYEIPTHQNILQPIYRNEFKEGDNTLYVEVSDYINVNNKVTQEDVYYVYQKLRDDKIIWLDPKIENVGKKDNGELIAIDLDLFFVDKIIDLKNFKQRINIWQYELLEKRYQFEQEKIKRYIK